MLKRYDCASEPYEKDTSMRFIIEEIICNVTLKDSKNPVVRGMMAAEMAVAATISSCYVLISSLKIKNISSNNMPAIKKVITLLIPVCPISFIE